jgi:glycosyltransferase involved in cell wall biosynthesis
MPLQEESLTPTSTLHGKRAAAVVFSYFPSDPRPARAAYALFRAGMTVDLFCLARDAQPLHETLSGVNVTRFRLTKRRGSKLYYIYQYLMFLAASFLWLTRRSGYDLVHVHNMPDFLVFAAVVAKLRGAKIVLDLHDPMPEVFITKFGSGSRLISLLRFFEKLSIRFSDLVLTPNKAFERLFKSRNSGRRIAVVMNAPLERIFPLRPPVAREAGTERPFILMYHGTLVERHGLHLALEAVAALRTKIPLLRFHLYGASTDYLTKTIFPLIFTLGLKERVTYFGELPLEEIVKRIEECDLGVIPNLKTPFTEINFPTRIFEYLACGKPVVVPDTEGIRDYFWGNEILFFTPGNVTALADKILFVAEHPQESAAFADRGQTVYNRYRWSGQEAKFIEEIANLGV